MRIIKNLMLIVLVMTGTMVQAQELFEFNKNSKLHEVPSEYKDESAIYLQSNRKVAYKLVEKNGDYMVRKTMTTHSVVKVLDNKGVEAFNTLQLPASSRQKYTQMLAQCLTSTGKRIEITKDKIKKKKDEEGNESYYIAFEGVDIGSEVEFLLESEFFVEHLEGESSYSSDFPIVSALFQLDVPSHLIFELKGYNGFGEAEIDSVSNEQAMIHTVKMANAKPIPDESYGNAYFLEPRVAYRFSYNPSSNGSVRVNSWNDLAKAMNSIYLQHNEKDNKKILKFLKDNGITSSLSEKEKVIKIEEAIKTKIVMNDRLASTEMLADLIKNKTGNSKMVTKLYCACFDLMDISYSLGLSSNRYQHQLDEDFELWNQLDIFIFQFNKIGGHMAPENITLRYPLIPLTIYGNKALLCKTRTLGGITTATANITKIKSRPAMSNSSIMNINVSFDQETMHPIVSTATEHYGITSTQYRPIFSFTDEKDHKDILIQLAGIEEKEDNIKSYEIKDYELDNIPKEIPCVISTTIESPQWLSKAGNTYLFQLGQTIGRQAEMYEEKEARVLPIDIQFTHHLIRKITVDLMPGYKIKNLDDIIIDKQFGDYGFISSYKIEGDKLLIDIDEYYKDLEFPKEQIAQFRSVINAAADFNKVTLVFEKE